MSAGAEHMVAILLESADGQGILQHARDTLDEFGVGFIERTVETRAVLRDTAAAFETAGAAVFVVANTSATPLSAAVAAVTARPVLAVPLEAPGLAPLEALRTTTGGGPAVASLAIGKAGAINAALLAVAILANANEQLRAKLERFRAEQTARVLADTLD
jgi:5-(carboxyamino)imidazole ribonucleotide mutase